jgi:hypothetical protein
MGEVVVEMGNWKRNKRGIIMKRKELKRNYHHHHHHRHVFLLNKPN